MSDSLLLEPLDHGFLSVSNAETVKKSGIYENTVGNIRICFVLNIAAFDHLDYGKVEFFCEIPVARIMRGNRHDRSGAVGCKDIVGYEDRDFSSVHGVDSIYSVETNAGFVADEFGTLKIRLFRRLSAIFLNLCVILKLILPSRYKSMLGSDDHISSTEKRIGTCCINGKLIARARLKINFGSVASADPIYLLRFDTLNKIEILEVVDKAVGISRYFKHPLALYLVDDFTSAALANAVYDLLVCKNDLA